MFSIGPFIREKNKMHLTEGILKVASRWTPPGKRKRGRPKTAWRRTVEMELNELGLTWGQAQALAKDKTRWRRDIVAAPCPTGGSKV